MNRQGRNIQAPVTARRPKGKAAKRKRSFCKRMKGMKAKMTSAKTAKNPNSRINKSLRKWRCR